MVLVLDLWSKGPRFESPQESRENFLFQGKLSVLLNESYFGYPFHPHATSLAHKRSLSLHQKCRWLVTAKHTCTLPVWLWMRWHCQLVHGCIVYTKLVLRWEKFQFQVALAMQQPNSAVRCQYTTLVDVIFKKLAEQIHVQTFLSALATHQSKQL